MSPAPFVERPEAVWFYCADCTEMYDGRYGHVCSHFPADEDPLAGARGIVYALCACAFVWALLVAAGFLKFRPF